MRPFIKRYLGAVLAGILYLSSPAYAEQADIADLERQVAKHIKKNHTSKVVGSPDNVWNVYGTAFLRTIQKKIIEQKTKVSSADLELIPDVKYTIKDKDITATYTDHGPHGWNSKIDETDTIRLIMNKGTDSEIIFENNLDGKLDKVFGLGESDSSRWSKAKRKVVYNEYEEALKRVLDMKKDSGE